MREASQDTIRASQLKELAREVENLKESPLYAFRKEKGYQPVFGEGDPNANILFIGEAPGEREARTGRPFVGASGRFLDELLEGIGLRRDQVYITNVVKDRPPENRDPKPDEIRLYAPILVRQIEIIQPRVIVTLGRFSMEFIFKLFDMPEQGGKISRLHGQPLKATAPHGEVTVHPLFHPAVALYNQGQREVLVQDFQVLKDYL